MGYLYLARPNYRCIRVCGCPVPASNRLLGRGRRFWARWNRNVPKACNGKCVSTYASPAAPQVCLVLYCRRGHYLCSFPPLIYAVPSGGASHIQFPIIGIGYYVHALLAGQRILPACLVVLPNRLKLGVGKANSRCWRPCSLGTVGRWHFFLRSETARPKSATEYAKYCQKVSHAHDIDRECSLFHSLSV